MPGATRHLLASAGITWQPGRMPNKLLVAATSALLLVLAAIVVVLRRARTEHPPVSPVVPRVDTLTVEADSSSAGSL
ncbi:hypothetical protein GCM10023197_17930 [Gordonia humi]